MKGLIKLHPPGMFHQYTICTYIFIGSQNARGNYFRSILGGFLKIFRPYLIKFVPKIGQ